ncbi:MAG: zinc carboxypeptidase, partial [Ruminococcus sp.]
SRMGEEPASENETKALIRIIQEYDGRGLLTFAQSGREIIYYHCQQGVGSLPKSYRLARHMQKSSSYHLEREQMTESAREKFKGMGTPEQYYIQTKKQPAFRIKVPAQSGNGRGVEEDKKAVYEEIHLLPLEYIFSLDN